MKARNVPPWWLRTLPFLLVAFFYFPAVAFPFFSDDILHFRYALEVQTTRIWTAPDITSIYYRPVVNFLIHVATVYLKLPLEAPLWHIIVIWNHMLNVALIGVLARRLKLSARAQFIAMLTLALMPLNVQAVVWILAWFHLLLMTALLSSVIFAIQYLRQPKRIRFLVFAWMAAIPAPFIHENGVLTPILLLIVILFHFGPSIRSRWKLVCLLLVAPVIAVFAYWQIRASLFGGQQPGLVLVDFTGKIAYFAQAVTFPIQYLMVHIPINDPLVQIWIGVILVFTLGLLVIIRRGGHIRLVIMATAWCITAALPAAAALLPGYLARSERLVYITLPGIALLYGTLIDTIRKQMRIVTVLIVGGTFVLTTATLMEYVHLYSILGNAYNEMFDNFRVVSTNRDMLVVNAPVQMDSAHHVFPLVQPHATTMHDYIPFGDFVWLNTGKRFEVFDAYGSAVIKDIWQGDTVDYYKYDLDTPTMSRLIRHHDYVTVFRIIDNQRFAAEVVGLRQSEEQTQDFLADFNHSVRLEEVTTSRENSDFVRIGLLWRKLDTSLDPYIVFVHLVCDGVIVDQSDAAPIANLYRFDEWPVNERWLEYRYLRLADADPGCLSLRVGLYLPESAQRASLTDSTGALLDMEWLNLPVDL